MQKNIALIIIVGIIIIVGVFMMNQKKYTQSADSISLNSQELNVPSQLTINQEGNMAITPDDQVKIFTIPAKEFSFSPSEISVKKGDKVRIILQNTGTMTHDWVVDEFSVRTKIIKPGETDTVEFTADKTGEFEYYCSVGQHRANGMKGVLIVTE